MEKKPLYRKINKITHNGAGHHDFGFKERHRFDRNKKQNKKDIEEGLSKSTIKTNYYNRNTDIGLFDYTPLYKFLLKKDGADWDEVWKECNERLNTIEPVFRMVVNINNHGVRCQHHDNWWGNHILDEDVLFEFEDCKYLKYFHDGAAGTYYSTMYVDENNILRICDPDYIVKPKICDPRWAETFNGERITEFENYI